MKQNNPLLTVIIPTIKKRVDNRLLHAVKSAVAIPAPDIEIIVHLDGSPGQPEFDLRREIPDKRFRVIDYPDALSMSENWNAAMHHASGEYVILIGDDDGVRKEVYEVAKWARDNRYDCVLQPNTKIYYWPSYPSDEHAGQIRAMKPTGKVVPLDMEHIRKYNSFGPKTRHYKLLPEVYHGLMRRKVMDAMKAKTGRYFGSAIPDLYFAFAMPPFINKAVMIDYPFSLSGYSGKANSGKFKASKIAIEKTSVQSHASWPAMVPETTDFVSYYAKSKLDAYHDTGQEELISSINPPLSYAHALFNRPWSKKRFHRLIRDYAKALKESTNSVTVGYSRLVFWLVIVAFQRVSLLLPPTFHLCERKNNEIFKKKPDWYDTSQDMTSALSGLDHYLQSCGITLRSILATNSL